MATLHIPTVPSKTRGDYPIHLQFDKIAIGKNLKFVFCL